MNPETTPLRPLAEVVADIGAVRSSLDAAELHYARGTLADRIWLGVLCLQGKEHHSLPVGRPKKKNTHAVSISAEAIHPQGFLAWISLALPGIAEPTAYKYMDAARGIGLDAWTPESEVRDLVAQRLDEFDARSQTLTLAMLVAQAKASDPPALPAPQKTAADHKTDAVQSLFLFMDEIINVQAELTPVERDTVINRLGEILRRLTGQEWSPVA